jgi:hypothetical protein
VTRSVQTKEGHEALEKRRKELRKKLTKVQGILVGGMGLAMLLWAIGVSQTTVFVIVCVAMFLGAIFS